MERLNDPSLTKEDLQAEITRAQAMSELGKVIIDSAKTQVMALKLAGKDREIKTITEGAQDFTDPVVIPLERPKAEYSNNGHKKIVDNYS